MRAVSGTFVVIGLVILAGSVIFRYSAGASFPYPTLEPPAVGTSGVAAAVSLRDSPDTPVMGPAGETSITATIKAKIALDDFVKERVIGVSTRNSVVTLTGRVQSPAEHDRAVSLARETQGVSRVVDRIVIEPSE